jgi:hypothetical protein
MQVTNRQFLGALIGSLFIALSMQGGLIAGGFYGISADESGRTLDAYSWITTGSPQSNVWLPFHRVLVGSVLFLWNDLFIVPRIISFLVGLIAFGILAWLAHELFHDRRITAVTALLAALFPQRVILSVVPLSEIEFIALLVAGMASYMRWVNLHRTKDILVSALFFGLGTTCRYEGWIFAAVFLFVLVLMRESRSSLLAYPLIGVLSVIVTTFFPVYWTTEYYIKNHVLFGFLAANSERYAQFLQLNFSKIVWHNPATQFVYHNGAVFNLVGIISILELIRKNKQTYKIIAIPLISLLIFTLIELAGRGITTHNPWRVIAVWSCFMLPYTGHWIIHHVDTCVYRIHALNYGILIVFILSFFIHVMMQSRFSVFTKEEYVLGRFLRDEITNNVKVEKTILIEGVDWSYLNIVVSSNMPDRIICNTGFDPYCPTPPIVNSKEPIDVVQLVKKGFQFLVFKSNLSFMPNNEFSLRELQHSGEWTVYKVVRSVTQAEYQRR